MLRQDNDDTLTIIRQIKTDRQSLNGITRILRCEGANAIFLTEFFMSGVGSTLLYERDFFDNL